MMTTSVAQLPPAEPIDEAQRRALTSGERAAAALRFAPKLATFNGAGLLLAAAVSLATALTDFSLVVWAIVLGASGWFELASGKKLRNFERDAPVRLAVNQLVLLLIVAGYAALRLQAVLRGDFSITAELAKYPELAGFIESAEDPRLAQAFDDLVQWVRMGLIATYSGLIVASVLVQGGAALYYWSRRKHLDALLDTTPSWVIDWMRSRR